MHKWTSYIVAGVAQASKAVVLDANKVIDVLDITILKVGGVTQGTGAEQAVLVGVTPGTAAASKAVVLGASKDIATITSATITTLTSTTVGATTGNITTVNATTGAITTVNATTVNATTHNAGADAVAGTVAIFPTTTATGKTTLTASSNSGATTTNINTAAQAGARTYTIPDAGANADAMLSTTQTALGAVQRIPLFSGRNNTYTTLDATGSTTAFKLAGTVGTATNLLTPAVNATTNTCLALWEVVLPTQYRAANNLTLTANVQRNIVGTGNTYTATIAFNVYLMSDAGLAGSDINATSVQTISAATGVAQELTYTITGASLTANARLLIKLTGVATETGGADTVQTQVNSIRLS